MLNIFQRFTSNHTMVQTIKTTYNNVRRYGDKALDHFNTDTINKNNNKMNFSSQEKPNRIKRKITLWPS